MGYEVGVARVDITPPASWIEAGRIWLWGYGSRTMPCTGVLDGLEARAFAVRDDGGATTIVLTLDVGALTSSFTDELTSRIGSSHGIDPEYTCVNVSHTHTAPVFASIPTWQPGVDHADDGYVLLAADAAVAAVELAIADLRPAALSFGRGATAIAFDRHPTGVPMDTTLDVVQAMSSIDNSTIAVLFSTACHPVCHGAINLISSDFVGPARAAVEAQFGGTALFVQGYAGTCNPSGAAAATGAALAADVGAVLAGAPDLLDGPLDAWATTVDLPLQPIPIGAVAAHLGDTDEVGRWARWMQAQGADVPSALTTPIQAIRIGVGRDAWYLVASAHEVVMDLAAEIRALWPYRRLTTAGYSNSQLSYLPGTRVLQTPPCTDFPVCTGNYEGGHAFVWYGHRGPLTLDAEALFIDANLELLDHGWEPIGHATSVVGMASWRQRLFAATSNDLLWWRPTTADDDEVIPWRSMGHAQGVCGLAACDGSLYATTTDGKLWKRSTYGFDLPWQHIGHATQVTAMTAMEGRLFAATTNNKLWRRDPVEHDVPWEDLGQAEQVVGLAVSDGLLFAATNDGGLHWRPPFAGDLNWHRYGEADEIVGMTAVDDTLYAATAGGTLWRRPI